MLISIKLLGGTEQHKSDLIMRNMGYKDATESSDTFIPTENSQKVAQAYNMQGRCGGQ